MDQILRLTQESRATSSTPQTNNSPISFSPSISSLSNTSQNSHVTEIDQNDRIEEISSLNSDEETTPSRETTIDSEETLGKIKWVGAWKTLMPKRKQSLYYKVFFQVNSIEKIIAEYLCYYQSNKETAIHFILQFFMDLSGHADFSIENNYEFATGNSHAVIKRLEDHVLNSTTVKDKFVLMKSSKQTDIAEAVISHFLNNFLLLTSRSGVLFDGMLAGHVFGFIESMSFSFLRSVRITGVVISLKILTALIMLYKQFITVLENNTVTGTVDELQERKITLEKCIDFFYIIFNKNCLLADVKCYFMRAQCAKEMLIWITHFPDTFILKRKCISHLMKLALDEHEMVRLSALDTCEKLIESPELFPQMQQRIEFCLRIVCGRILDVSFNVALKTVEVFTKAVDKYAMFFESDDIQLIVSHIFHENLLLAKAAGKFLLKYLNNHQQDERAIFMTITSLIASKEEFYTRLPFCLEACQESAPCLENWNLIVDLLLDNKIPIKSRKCILAIANESIRYHLKGKHSKSRHPDQEDLHMTNSEKHLAVAMAVIVHFKNLTLIFKGDKHYFRLLIQILTYINHDYSSLAPLKQCYYDIIVSIKEIFSESQDQESLEILCDIIHMFVVKNPHLEQRAKSLLTNLQTNYVKPLSKDLTQLSPICPDSELRVLKQRVLKTSILFAKFDLRMYLKWEDLSKNDNYPQILKYLVVCRKWHLLWSLRDVMKNYSSNNDIEELACGDLLVFNSHIEQFVSNCLNLLMNPEYKSISVLLFENICDFYITCSKELKRKSRLMDLIPKITNQDALNVLFKFITAYIIENTRKMNLELRRKYFCNVTDLLYLGIIPVENFSRILQFYQSHFEEFGETMNEIISQLKLFNPALSAIIMHTMAESYLTILKKYDLVNIRYDEARQLKMLVKKFTSHPDIKAGNILSKLIYMGLNFAFKSESNYSFLYFLKYYVNLLKEDSKSDILQYFKQNIPRDAEKNDMMLLFATYLK